MGIVTAAVVVAACMVLAVLATGSRFRPLPAGLAVVGASGSALLVPAEHTFVRFVFAALGLVLLMRVLDLRLDRRPWSTAMRTWLCLGVVDVREAVPASRRIDAAPWMAIALYFGLAGFGWWVAHVPDPASQLLRWGGGVLVIYGLADAVCGLAVPVHRLFGWKLPEQHRAPILATSVGAFWSRHYNLNVSAWLARHCHRPLARRGRPQLGLLFAFGMSGLVHAWIAWVALEHTMAASMGAFFLVQAIAAALERSWPAFFGLPIILRRSWTIAWLLLPSPLFVEPFLRILEG